MALPDVTTIKNFLTTLGFEEAYSYDPDFDDEGVMGIKLVLEGDDQFEMFIRTSVAVRFTAEGTVRVPANLVGEVDGYLDGAIAEAFDGIPGSDLETYSTYASEE